MKTSYKATRAAADRFALFMAVLFLIGCVLMFTQAKGTAVNEPYLNDGYAAHKRAADSLSKAKSDSININKGGAK